MLKWLKWMYKHVTDISVYSRGAGFADSGFYSFALIFFYGSLAIYTTREVCNG